MTKKSPLVLIILDGWGYREKPDNNAIAQAKTPFFDALMEKYPHTLLNASEGHVGLPEGQIGNSEIGHQTIGCGRVLDADLVKINKAAKSGKFISNPAFTELFDHVKKYNSTLHVLGLVSPGGIHSHRDHLYAFLMAAKAAGVKQVAIHAFADGRDVPPKSASGYLEQLEEIIEQLQIGFIATVTGRFYAMDRDKNWDRVKTAEDAIFLAQGGTHKHLKPSQVVSDLYKKGIVDELLEPLVFLDDTGKGYPISENDGVFFFNYRPDRARELSAKILEKKRSQNLCFVTMTEYDKTMETLVAFPKTGADTTLAGEISKAGLSQSHIAETEKYPHVTYFFNGGREEPHKNEHHFLIQSRQDIKTHDQAPQMRAKEISDKVLERLAKGDDFILVNFANADMVGHTANVPAIITAVETVDAQLKRITDEILKRGGTAIITADHGNAELNIDDQTGERHTAHTLNLVPFIIIGGVIPSESDEPRNPLTSAELKNKGSLHSPSTRSDKNRTSLGVGRDDKKISLRDGTLADVAPTILQLMDLPKPKSMTGTSLVK